MAVQTVLDIPELLEAILLNVDVKTILLAHRVSTTFCTSINHSPRLQQRLWIWRKPHDPTAPVRNYFFNLLIDNNRRRLGIDRLLSWKLDKENRLIINLYFRSFADVADVGTRSCNYMIVAQPTQPIEIVWSVGFYEPLKEGRPVWKEQRLRKRSVQWADGRLPTLGELKEVIMERFGVVDGSCGQEDEEAEVMAE